MGRIFLGKKVLLICWLVQTKEGKRQQKPGGGGWQQKTMGTWVGDAESGRVLFFYTTMVLPSPSFFLLFSRRALSKLHPIATALKISDFRSVPSRVHEQITFLSIFPSQIRMARNNVCELIASVQLMISLNIFFWTNLPIPIFPTHEHDYQNQYAVCCCKYAHRR